MTHLPYELFNIILGESAVGKSSLVLRFVKGQFHEFQEVRRHYFGTAIGYEINTYDTPIFSRLSEQHF